MLRVIQFLGLYPDPGFLPISLPTIPESVKEVDDFVSNPISNGAGPMVEWGVFFSQSTYLSLATDAMTGLQV